MIWNLINLMFGDYQDNCPNRQENKNMSVAPDVNKKSATDNDILSTAARSPEKNLEEEILLLARTHGPLANGVRIELGLQEALKLFPRTRRRSDAFGKLIKKVRDEYGTELIITSKTKK